LGLCFQNKINYKSVYSTDKDTTLGYNEYSNRATVNSISVSAAYSITRFLGVGITYNYWLSMGNEADDYSFYNTRTWDKERYPYNQNVIESHETFRYYGSNFTAGILMDFSPFRVPLRFALRYESKFALKDAYEADYSLSYRYSNNIDTTYAENYHGTEKYFFPSIFSAGLSYRIGDYFTIACDFDIRPFKDEVYTYEYKYCKTMVTSHTDTLDYSENVDAYYLLKSNANLNQFRIGLEYIFHPKFAFIPVRAGWKNNPTSISDQSTKDQVYAHSLNFGTGLILKRISVDFAYERYAYSRNVLIIDEYYTEEKIFNSFILSLIVSL
jgi:hypothetical protein